MTCPRCNQPVLTTEGTQDNHLNPDTLQPCVDDKPAKPAAKKAAAKKAPAKGAKRAKQ